MRLLAYFSTVAAGCDAGPEAGFVVAADSLNATQSVHHSLSTLLAEYGWQVQIKSGSDGSLQVEV